MRYPKRSWTSLGFDLVGWVFVALLAVGLVLAVLSGLLAAGDSDGGTRTVATLFLGLPAVLFLGLGAIGLGFRLRRAGQMVRLRDQGTLRRAVVTRHQPTNARVNGQHQYVLFWRDDAGVEGRSRYRRPDVLPPVGEAITIYADPDGVLPPVWDGDSGTR